MLNTLSIKNFRGFRDLTVEPLDRVNLIAGKNNVGKTALLEALYLLLAPRIPGTQLMRGLQALKINQFDKWRWIFHQQIFHTEIEIGTSDSNNVTRTLTIGWYHIDEEWLQLPLPLRYRETPNQPFTLRFQYVDNSGAREGSTSIDLSQGDFNPHRGRPRPASFNIPIVMLPSSFTHSPTEYVRIFSDLVAHGRQELIIDTLRLMEPRLANLSVLVLTDIPMVYAELDSKELIPIAQMGEGVGRIFSLLLNIASVEGGILLIDEIENGLHHSVMPNVWKAIAIAARSTDVQIFATTHSWECIQAAHEAFSKSEVYDFRLHRLDRVGDDVQAVTYNEATLETSVAMGLEVR